MAKERLTILLSSGLEAPEKARSALMFASIGASMGHEVVVYCILEGALVVKRGALYSDRGKMGVTTLWQRLEEALQAGVKFEVCKLAAEQHGINEEDLIDNARIVGASRLIELAMESDGVLSF